MKSAVDDSRPRSLHELAAKNFHSLSEFKDPNWPVALTMMPILAAFYGFGVSVWRGESIDGWLWNAIAGAVGGIQTFAWVPILALSFSVGATLFDLLLDRTHYRQRRYEHANSSDWEWWVSMVPAVLLGAVVLVALTAVVYAWVWSIPQIGPRILTMFLLDSAD